MSNHADIYGASDTCSVKVVDVAAVSAVRNALPAPLAVDRAAAIFDALSDPTRLKILISLSVRELCVCDLAETVGISQSGVSHQLRYLRTLDLVAFNKVGRRAVYRLADAHVETLVAQALDHAAEPARSRP